MYQVFTFEKYKSTQAIGFVASHNNRSVPCANVNKTKTKNNQYLIGQKTDDVEQLFKDRLQKIGKYRKDANIGIGIVLSASPEFFDKDNLNDWKKASLKWVEETFGKENIIQAVLHMDEKTPHIHILLIPEKDNKLKSSFWFDGPAKLNALHTSYSKVNKQFGLKRGESKKKPNYENIESYYKKVNSTKKYDDKLDRQVDEFLESIKNPSFKQKLTPWTYIDDVMKPFITRLTTNLKHYRAKAKHNETLKKDLILAQQKIDDMSLKLTTLGLSSQVTFAQCEKLQPTVLLAMQHKPLPTEDGFAPAPKPPQSIETHRPKFH
jgi:hypothetical protein